MKTHIITAISYMIMALIPAAVIYAVIILISTKLERESKEIKVYSRVFVSGIHLDNIGNNRNYWNAI